MMLKFTMQTESINKNQEEDLGLCEFCDFLKRKKAIGVISILQAGYVKLCEEHLLKEKKRAEAIINDVDYWISKKQGG